jgi:hypothetical protein
MASLDGNEAWVGEDMRTNMNPWARLLKPMES